MLGLVGRCEELQRLSDFETDNASSYESEEHGISFFLLKKSNEKVMFSTLFNDASVLT